MSGLNVPGFTIKKEATRLRRGSFGSVGSNKSSGRRGKEDQLISKTDDNFVEQAHKEHVAQSFDEMRVALEEVDNSRKVSRKKALQLSKASTQIAEATQTAQELSKLALSHLHRELPERNVTLKELEELKGKEDTLNELSGDGEDMSQISEASSAPSSKEKGLSLLDSMQQLSKATRAIVARKDVLESQVRALRDEYIKEKRAFEQRLQDALAEMERLREQKRRAELQTSEVRMEYDQQIKQLKAQAEDAQQSLRALEAANTKLKASVEDKETALMQVPRLEEEYLRTARKLVVKKERVVQQKTLAMKKMEGDVNKAAFWQQKAVLLGEENLALKTELADFKRCNIQALTKLQWELQQETSKNRPHNKHAHTRAVSTTDSADSPRKKSIAVAPTHSAYTAHMGHTGHTAHTAHTGHVSLARGTEMSDEAHIQQFHEAEIARLKEVVEGLRDHNRSLTLKLAHARSYPLLNTRPEPDEDDLEDGKHGLEAELEALFHPENEEEEDAYGDDRETRAERESEEARAAQRRIERAINMNEAYKNKLAQLRSARPGSEHFKTMRRLKGGRASPLKANHSERGGY